MVIGLEKGISGGGTEGMGTGRYGEGGKTVCPFSSTDGLVSH